MFGFAERAAVSLGSQDLSTGHLLLGLMDDEHARDGSPGPLATEGVEREAVREALARNSIPREPLTAGHGEEPLHPPLSVEAKSAVDHAAGVSDERLDYTIGVRHLLVGLLEEPGCVAARILAGLDVDRDALRLRALTGIDDDTSPRASAGLEPVLQQQMIIMQILGQISTRLDAIEARLDRDDRPSTR